MSAADTYNAEFPDLAFVYLEDSWVIGIEPGLGTLHFALDVVLTPGHPAYSAPSASEQHCYRRAGLSIRADDLTFAPSGALPASDAAGDTDYGNIDTFDQTTRGTWRLTGDWGTAVAYRPEVHLTLDP